MRTAAVWLFLLLLAPGLPVSAAPHPHKAKKILDLADKIDDTAILSKFAALVRASDLGTFLSSRGPFTLFAPTNSAFSKLPPGMYDDLLRPENKTQLQRIVLFHVVNGQSWDVKDLQKTKSLISCEGNPLPLKTSRLGTQYVAKARLIRADEKCPNGVLDEIDTLLMPPQLGVLVSGPPNPAPAPPNSTPDANSPPGADATDTKPVPDTSEPDTNVPPVPAIQ